VGAGSFDIFKCWLINNLEQRKLAQHRTKHGGVAAVRTGGLWSVRTPKELFKAEKSPIAPTGRSQYEDDDIHAPRRVS